MTEENAVICRGWRMISLALFFSDVVSTWIKDELVHFCLIFFQPGGVQRERGVLVFSI